MEYLLTLIFLGWLINYGLKHIFVVKQDETIVIECLGQYNRLLEKGVNIICPLIEMSRPIYLRSINKDSKGIKNVGIIRSNKIDLREMVYDFPDQSMVTKDNAEVQITSVLSFQIINPVKTAYEIANLAESLEKLVKTILQHVVKEFDLPQIIDSKDVVSTKSKEIISDAAEKWGLKVNWFELQDVTS